MIIHLIKHTSLLLVLAFSINGFAQTFVEANEEAGIFFSPNAAAKMGGGAAWFDYDNDGWEDLYIAGCQFTDRLYRNNQDGTFSDVTESAGLLFTGAFNTTGVVTGDIDNDGDNDVFLSTWRYTDVFITAPSVLLLNNGDGTFQDISESAGIIHPGMAFSACFTDVNNDSFLDIYASTYMESPGFTYNDEGQINGFAHDCYQDLLYLNNGDNTFEEVSDGYGTVNLGCALACAATDFDRDGDADILVANDFGEFIVPNRLFENQNGSDSFSEISETANADFAIYGMGVAIGDYDEDQDFDYYITNLGRNVLMNNQGDGTFIDVSTEADVENTSLGSLFYTSWGTQFLDYDNDTYLDLFVANGHIPTVDFVDNHLQDPNKLYRNNQADGTFEDVSEYEGIDDNNISRGSTMVDYDHDGDVDLLTVNVVNDIFISEEHCRLFKNEGNDANWVSFTFEGVECNRNAYGLVAELHADDRIFISELNGGSSHASQDAPWLHFGLGSITEIDSLVMFWPDGTMQSGTFDINQMHHIVQGQTSNLIEWKTPEVKVYPNPAAEKLTIELPFIPEYLIWVDGMGRQVDHFSLQNDLGTIFEIEVSNKTPGGWYFCSAFVNGRTVNLPPVLINK